MPSESGMRKLALAATVIRLAFPAVRAYPSRRVPGTGSPGGSRMKAFAFGLLAILLFAGLAGVVLHQNRQIRRLEAGHADKTAAEAPPDREAAESAAAPRAEREAEAVRPPEPPPTAPAPSAAAPGRAGSMAEMARMAMSPGMKDLIRAQQKGQLELLYGSLLKYLELSGVDSGAFRELLLDRQMAILGVALESMGREGSPRDREARIRQAKTDSDAKILELLGPEHFSVFESYEATQAERVQVTLFKNSLPSEDGLTEDQEDRLIRTLHEERSRSPVASEEFGARLSDPSGLTAEGIQLLLAESAKLREKYVARAASVLTPRQLEQFKASQDQQQAMLGMGLKMAAGRFAPAADPPPADDP